MTGPYEDIIHLPHHVSAARPQMPLVKRAAQFSPFKAMVGYDLAVEETARLTDKRIELDESEIAVLDMKLRMLAGVLADYPVVAVTCFQEDEKKEGGSYRTISSTLKKIDTYNRVVIFTTGERIRIADIFAIESDLFKSLL